jgi:hypothetical protein
MSQSHALKKSLRHGFFVCSFVLALPVSLLAQEATSPPKSPTTGSAQTQPTGRPYLSRCWHSACPPLVSLRAASALRVGQAAP